MTQFAVCDKEEAVIAMIEQYKRVNEIDISLYKFKNGISLEKRIQMGIFFDAVFLDIEMEGKNGIEVGKWLRETKKMNERKLSI